MEGPKVIVVKGHFRGYGAAKTISLFLARCGEIGDKLVFHHTDDDTRYHY